MGILYISHAARVGIYVAGFEWMQVVKGKDTVLCLDQAMATALATNLSAPGFCHAMRNCFSLSSMQPFFSLPALVRLSGLALNLSDCIAFVLPLLRPCCFQQVLRGLVLSPLSSYALHCAATGQTLPPW